MPRLAVKEIYKRYNSSVSAHREDALADSLSESDSIHDRRRMTYVVFARIHCLTL